MNRRVIVVIAALIIPGGLIALVGAALVKAFAGSSAGRRAWNRIVGFWRGATPSFETLQRAT